MPVLKHPLMPYTRRLLRSVPRLEIPDRSGAALEAIPGSVPDPSRLPSAAPSTRAASMPKELCATLRSPRSRRCPPTISSAAIAGAPLKGGSVR